MKILKILLAAVMFTFVLNGCKYSFIVPEEVIIPDPNKDISFAEEIEPIFNAGNLCTSCHNTGGQLPNLSTGNAYAAINASRYINRSTPEESLIYTYPHPDTNTHTRKKYSASQAILILTWIQQGAKDN
jgi:hypothetical protein